MAQLRRRHGQRGTPRGSPTSWTGTPRPARVNPDATVTLYDALAAHAGVDRPKVTDDPRVAADVLVHADGTRYAWLVTHAPEPVTVKPILPAGLQLTAVEGDPVAASVSLRPFGIGVFRLSGRGHGPSGPGD